MNCKNCGYGLKQRCGDFEKIICTYEEGECVKITELEKACDETQKLLDKQIEATYKLDKENAELKAVERMALYSKMSDQSTKAKDIIKILLKYDRGQFFDDRRIYEQYIHTRGEAEQFLKEE